MKIFIDTVSPSYSAIKDKNEYHSTYSLKSQLVSERIELLTAILERDGDILEIEIHSLSDFVKDVNDKEECQLLIETLVSSGHKIKLVVPRNISSSGGHLLGLISENIAYFELINKRDSQEFIQECMEVREVFFKEIKRQEYPEELNGHAQNILIMYDQLMGRIQKQMN